MKRIATGLSGPAVAFLLAGAVPAAAQMGDAYRGSALAQAWCASCHVIGSKGSGRAADMAPPFPAVAGKPISDLAAWISREHTRMPNFNLGRREIDDLVAYIRSLAVK
jgi:mono/diheme cytochrome c family protein